jgi:hypothetical protein
MKPVLPLLAAALATTPAPGPLRVDATRQLFLDDHAVAAVEGLERVFHRPERHPANPILTGTEPWERWLIELNGRSAVYDEERRETRLYYGANLPDAAAATQTRKSQREVTMSGRRSFLSLMGLGSLASSGAAGRAVGQPRGPDRTWRNVYSLDAARKPSAGSAAALHRAIRNAADLRIETAFRYDEHIDTTSSNREIVNEICEFPVTYLLDDRWTAGVMSLRGSTSDDGRPLGSFFLYNQDGLQARAHPYLDGRPAAGRSLLDHGDKPKYHELDRSDTETPAPISAFIYDFELFRFWVRDDWEEVLSHGPDGRVTSGSVRKLVAEFGRGREVKVAVRDGCADLAAAGQAAVAHEVFVQTHSCYNYSGQGVFTAATHPIVRVAPAIPLRYRSGGWNFGWLRVGTDGTVARSLVDPRTMKFTRKQGHHALRWFVR